MDINENLEVIKFLFVFFIVIRIIGFWMSTLRQDNQRELLEEILQELKEKNQE
jgi:hypothetical protein